MTGHGEMERDMKWRNLLRLFPEKQKEKWVRVLKQADELREIRIRIGQPVAIVDRRGEIFFTDLQNSWIITEQEINDIFQQICGFSPYAYEDEIRQGFLTVSGGHRIGITGRTVLDERGKIRTIKYVQALNIRVSHEVIGAADEVMPYLYDGENIKNTLILSLPGVGKTTLLRDIVRQLSDGNSKHCGVTVGVVDERSEIAACHMGSPQNDLGRRTDVLDACPKAIGISMLVRAMTPRVIAVDELMGKEDISAVEEAMGCGCSIIATLHGKDPEDILWKFGDRSADWIRRFQLFIMLDRVGNAPHITEIRERRKADASFDRRSPDPWRNLWAGHAV